MDIQIIKTDYYMNFGEKRILGKTGLKIGRLGISSSYGVKSSSIEEAFEHGCNYLSWGTFVKGHSDEMKKAVQNIIKNGRRDQLVLSYYTYAHSNYFSEKYLQKKLKAAGTDYVDVLLLGYFSNRPRQGLIDGAIKLREKGLVRFIGISGHNRKLFPKLEEEGIFDVFHTRYNAAHRGAEKDVFPYMKSENGAGIVTFVSTKNGKLLNPKKMPTGEAPLTAVDCYRFILSNPAVDACMMGVKNTEQMKENLKTLEMGPLNEEEMKRVRRIGDYLHK